MSLGTSRKALCAVGLVLVLAGIASAKESKIDPDFVASRATAVVHRIVQGLSEGDYSLFTQDFSKAMKDAQTRDSFLELQRKLQKSLGKFQSLEYLGYYEQYGGIITLFKARFRKEKEDVLIKVVLDGKKAEPQVTGLWFESPSLEK
jgi:hypothetical protein